jgi:hypothetical protein
MTGGINMEFIVVSDNLPELAKFRPQLKTAFSTHILGGIKIMTANLTLMPFGLD